MIVVDHVTKFFLKWKRLEVHPSLPFCLKNVDSILKLIDFLRLSRDKLFIFFRHASKNDYVIGVETESKIVGDPLRHLDIKDRPDSKLRIVALNRI